MSNFSAYDLTSSPPNVVVPHIYNAAVDFVDRNVAEGKGNKVAFIDDNGSYTFSDLLIRTNKCGNVFKSLNVQPEQRILMLQLDTIDFPAVFFGAIKSGVVPVPVNTLLKTDDYRYILEDSRARALVISSSLLPVIAPILQDLTQLDNVIVTGETEGSHYFHLNELLDGQSDELIAESTTADDVAFWLYSSGSTGRPKGAPHLQSDLINTAVLYGLNVIGLQANDVVFSAAKLFFAYGLGNALTFPLAIGATSVLMSERPTPQSVMKRLHDHQVTVFYGVPTLYAGILADKSIGKSDVSSKLKTCVSAGEALPEDIARRWLAMFGIEILDGLGSTEMLHIFISNSSGNARFGSSGIPVPGYQCRLIDNTGSDVPNGEIGDLLVNGPTAAPYYWNQRKKSLDTFQGPWTKTGDKYYRDEDGYFYYAGRADDMLKVSGIWVSPFEVESALIEHSLVLECAVVGKMDRDKLVKPKAFVVLENGSGSEELEAELKQFVKDRITPHGYPRWIEFVAELPKTATGKIQRFRLRA